jgi:hypothetical protein
VTEWKRATVPWLSPWTVERFWSEVQSVVRSLEADGFETFFEPATPHGVLLGGSPYLRVVGKRDRR